MRRRDPGALAPPMEIVLDEVRVEAGVDAATVGRAVEARVRAELAARGLAAGAAGAVGAAGMPGAAGSGSAAIPAGDGVSRAVSAALARAGYPGSGTGSRNPPTGSRP